MREKTKTEEQMNRLGFRVGETWEHADYVMHAAGGGLIWIWVPRSRECVYLVDDRRLADLLSRVPPVKWPAGNDAAAVELIYDELYGDLIDRVEDAIVEAGTGVPAHTVPHQYHPN